MASENWKEAATRLLRVEMQRRGATFKELSRRLELLGVEIASPQLSNNVNRGAFSLVFFLQCMRALEVDVIRLSDERELPKKKPKTGLKAIEARLRASIK